MCCLKEGHWARACSGPTYTQCNSKHHILLHFEQKAATTAGATPRTTSSADSKRTQEAMHVTTSSAGERSDSGPTSFMRTLVVVHGKDASATANVLLDSGSSCSYVLEC